MEKVKRKLKVIYCIECVALKCTFQREDLAKVSQAQKSHFSIFRCTLFYLPESVWRWKRDEHVDAHSFAEKRFNSIKITSIMFKLLHISCTLMWAACDLGKGLCNEYKSKNKNPHWTCEQKHYENKHNIVVRQKSFLGAKTINRNWVGDSRQ